MFVVVPANVDVEHEDDADETGDGDAVADADEADGDIDGRDSGAVDADVPVMRAVSMIVTGHHDVHGHTKKN